ncbi:MAG: PEGA domain-containing protein [Myxococcaceae bacterium]
MNKRDTRKATPAELIAATALLVAALVLTGTIAQLRLAGSTAMLGDRPVDPLSETVITPQGGEGVTYTSGAKLLFIDSEPDGAEARVAGTLVGQTPWSADLQCAGPKTKVELRKAGWQTATVEVDCERGTAHVKLSLKRK